VGFVTAYNGQIFKTTNAGGPATKDSLYWSTNLESQPSIVPTNIKLFPNPSHGTLNITWDFESPNNGQLTLLDGRGRTIYKKEMPRDKELNLNLEELSPGLYFVSVNTPNGVEVLRWVKE